ncbi:hypothetical protein G3I47_31800 [Streptomyces anulatus]|nr:hypothetical protein [Streptomyces anulatus]NDZ61797.1 hypothetical protein [Streptomyces anulatus]
MRKAIFATATSDGFLLRLTEAQKDLISEVLLFQADRPGGYRTSVVRLGVDRESASQVMRKVSDSNPEFSLHEIHVLFAALSSTPIMIPSEEAFYERIGSFRENSFALAAGLLNAAEAASDKGGNLSVND